MKIVGAVLAGGYSRRMGRDKATLPLAGEPLWRRQTRVLREAGADPVGLVRRKDQSALARPCWRDRRPNCGPLAGLETALRHAQPGAAVAVLAVDMPLIGPEWFTWLAARRRDEGGVVARHGKWFEPLAAIYPAAAVSIVSRRLDEGNYSLQDLVRELLQAGHLRAVPTPSRHLPGLLSVNTVAACRSIISMSSSPHRARASTR